MSSKNSWSCFALLAALVGINIIAYHWHFRWDITEDNVYSLSEDSAKFLSRMDRDVSVKFYFSRGRKQLPVVLKNYGLRVEEVLAQFAKTSKGKISLQIIDPQPDSDQEDWARRYGITAAQLPDGELVYFGAVVIRGVVETPIAYFDPSRERYLEFDLCEALYRATLEQKPAIGILSTLAVTGSDLQMQLPNVTPTPPWAFVGELQKMFEVRKIPSNADRIDPKLAALIVIHPKKLTDTTQYAIDQYAMAGGKLFIALDPLSRVEIGRLPTAMQQKSIPDPSSSLDTLFSAWGMSFNNAVVGDLENAARVSNGSRQTSYPLFISVPARNMAKNSVITRQLNEVLIAEGGSVGLAPGSVLSISPLLRTSTKSGLFKDAFLAGYIGQQDLDRQLNVDGESRTLAALFKGPLHTAFPKGKPVDPNAPKDAKTPREIASQPHLMQTKGDTEILVVGDTDFLRDENSVQFIRGAPNAPPTIRPVNDNLRFALGGVEYLTGRDDLLSLRTHGQISRPFTTLRAIEAKAYAKWRQEDDAISKRLETVEKRINELQQLKSAENLMTLSPEQIQEVNRFRVEEAQVKKQRKEVRRKLREDVETLGQHLTLANLGMMPLAIGFAGFQFFFRRSKKMRKGERKHA